MFFSETLPREILGQNLPGSVKFISAQLGEQRAPALPSEDSSAPIFLLSAGWRSGSTLLQRICSTSPSTIIWGEPFGDRVPICRLASMVDGFQPGDSHLKYECRNATSDLSKQWIANMNPGLLAVRNAHHAFFESLFAIPAQSVGYTRWGIKFVRVSAYHAHYLRWLYPDAKIVLHVRHPLDCYRSYRGKSWFTVKNSFQVRSLRRFLAHWKYMSQSFLSEAKAVEGHLIKYEDLIANPQEVDRLAAYLGTTLDSTILDTKVASGQDATGHYMGSSQESSRSASSQPINRNYATKEHSWFARTVAKLMVGSLCRELGYSLS